MFDQCYTMETTEWLMSNRLQSGKIKNRKSSDEEFKKTDVKRISNKNRPIKQNTYLELYEHIGIISS